MMKKFICMLTCMMAIATAIHAQSIQTAEYFWDTDPGIGNGMVLTAVDGSFNEAIEDALATVSNLPSIGSHIFAVRFKDGDNTWGPVFRTTVQVLPNITTIRAIAVDEAEVFWDNDPGQGNATAMIAFNGNFDEAIETLIKNSLALPAGQGVHTLNIRAKDVAGNWGPVFSLIINKEPNITSTRSVNIAAAEYFWDTDPGAGNGNVLLAFDGNFNQALEVVYNQLSVAALNPGVHRLGLRVKDAAGNWGVVFSTIVEIQSSISTIRAVKVISGEYYFDTDPGNGNATPMIAFDGNFNNALETIAGNTIPSPVSQGTHTLYMRAKDIAGNWGRSFGVVVNVDTSINSFSAVISGLASFCSPVTNPQGYSTPLTSGNSYSWNIIGGSIVSGQGTNAVQVNWNATGFHSITVIECNAGQTICDTAQLIVNIYSSQTVNQTQSICNGDSILIHGQWQFNAGVYSQVYASSNGCDSTVIVTLGTYPSYSIQNTLNIVSGDSVFLAGAWRKTPGTYIDNFTTINGCDSIVTTTVIVTFTTNISGATALCQTQAINIPYVAALHPGSSYNWSVNGGNITGSSGINQVTVTWNVSGNNTITVIECNSNLSFCDTAVLTVVVAAGVPVISNINICTGDSVFINNAWQTAAGTFYDTIPGSGACDTILITNLGVYPNYADTTQLVINSGDSAFLAGAWQHTTGVYVDNFISSAGCDSIIVTYLLVIVGLEEASKQQFELWPNPASDGFYLKNLSTQTGMISVFDQNGRLLLRQMASPGLVYIDVRMFAVGMYYLQMEANEKRYFRRLEIVR
ncbi:MAG: T9SS type A sorting domain-containing protein [Bacteroidetes bacterium]|jgi:hypothetical protein|nr:T9SS type A sorting domain-containing protein [Bacteroidota bacterium]